MTCCGGGGDNGFMGSAAFCPACRPPSALSTDIGVCEVTIGLNHGDDMRCPIVNDLHCPVLPIDQRVKLVHEWIAKYNW